MVAILYLFTVLCVAVSAAPPAPPQLYSRHASAQLNPLDYYLDNSDVANYYSQAQQKQGPSVPNGAPARLETLEPDSEVELIPGAQTPQQPPQQPPVAPNIPGLLPGQRVFIVHMPVPGYRPGTIGGYQPVYIVAAAPQGNAGFPGNGYQNTVLLDPSGQAVISPLVGYPRGVPGVASSGANPGLVLGAPLVNRPFDLLYQDPSAAYQPIPAQGPDANRSPVRLAQLVSLQGQAPASGNPKPTNSESTSPDSKRLTQAASGTESKEAIEEPRRNARPAPPHAQVRNKA